jgi:hypothetical protein
MAVQLQAPPSLLCKEIYTTAPEWQDAFLHLGWVPNLAPLNR